MNINVQTIHFDADDDLLSLIDKKMGKLEKFKEYIVNGELYLKKEGKGKVFNKIAEVKTHVKGKTLFAKDEETTLRLPHTFDAVDDPLRV
jgi:putative sigma-54 modulation protein